MKNKKQVIKHSAATQISNNISLLQRRTWNLLLAHAFDDLDKKDIFEISLKDLCESLDYDSKDFAYIKQLLRDLVNTTVEWNILKKDKEEWGIAALLAEAKIIDGQCFYSYGPMFRKRLHNPSMYAKINLSLQNKFSSKHTLAIYELCLDYFIAKKGYGETPSISVENFRKLLGLKENEYKEFMDLNKHILKKSIAEINTKSDLLVTVEYQRQMRKIVSLKFHIDKNPNSAIDLEPILKSLQKINDSESEKATDTAPKEIENSELYQTLKSYGISKSKAVEIIKAHDELYIRDVLKAVDIQVKSGKIKDVPSFTVKAIEKDFRSGRTKFDIEKEEQEQQRLEITKAIQEAENKKRQEEISKIERERQIEEAIKALSESERQALQKKAEKSVIKRLGELSPDANKFAKMNRQVCIEIEMQKIFSQKHL